MLHSNAERLTDFLFSRCPLEPAKRSIFLYGFELALSTLSSFLSIILLSILLGDVFSSLLFIAVFFFLRLFAGGFHASTYTHCFIITNSVYLAVFAVSRLLEVHSVKPVILVLGIVSCTAIYGLAPIKNRKHPLSQARYRRNQKIARALAALEALIIILITIFGDGVHQLSIFSASLMAVAVMMIIPRLKERRG